MSDDTKLAAAASALVAPGTAAQQDPNDKERAAKLVELRDLGHELGTYIQYAITIRQIFNDAVTQAKLTMTGDGSLNALAKARQLLSVNPGITRALTATFRQAHALPAFT